MVRLSELAFKSTDGLECYGYLSLPNNKNPPCIVELPAGIRSSVLGIGRAEDRFYTHLDDFLNNLGYAVFHIDRRGSMGHGVDFELKKDYGSRDVDDIIQGTEHLLKQNLVNNNHVGMYMACSSCIPGIFALSRTTTFKFGIMVSGVFDIALQANYEMKSGSKLKPMLKLINASRLDMFPFNERSPINHALKFNIPLFMYHGRNDVGSPVEQSRRMSSKLKREGNHLTYKEVDDFPHLRLSSDPTTEIGRKFWSSVTQFLRDNYQLPQM
jgi:dipeptidyl aminopeptidase/acylaminoacyl peptidase